MNEQFWLKLIQNLRIVAMSKISIFEWSIQSNKLSNNYSSYTITHLTIYFFVILSFLAPSVKAAACTTTLASDANHCQTCTSPNIQILISPSKTVCGTFSGTTCTVDSSYTTEAANGITYTYYAGTGGSNPYCYDCISYFNRSPQLCGLCSQATASSDYFLQSVYSQTQGCFSCSQSSMQQLSVVNIAHVGLKMRECTASGTQPVCTYTQFYDSTSKTCKECRSVFANCASCTASACLTCPQGFYWHSAAWDPALNTNRPMCVFNVCPDGYCKNPFTNQCEAISTTTNCQVCTKASFTISGTTSILQTCEQCKSGYVPQIVTAGGATTCKAVVTTAVTLTYFVKSGAPVLTSGGSYTAKDGLTPTNAFSFIQEAFTALYAAQASGYQNVTQVYIYLGKTTHFFFQCDGDETTTTYGDAAYANVIKYCDAAVALSKLQKSYPINDNVKIEIDALWCDLGSDLSLASDATFLAMCFPANSDVKPTIYVNHPNAYFNITGTFKISNIKFSGINAFAAPTSPNHDLSVWPTLFCSVSREPTGYDIALGLNKESNTNTAPFSYSCKDSWTTVPTKIDIKNTTRRCALNSNAQFYPQQESTLACPGEPSHSNFFWQATNGVYSKRRYSLFNLYSFSNYISNYNMPPQLIMKECDFEYFLGGYESLINVENNNLQKVAYTLSTTTSGGTVNDERTFYVQYGADRGAQIKIEDSVFKHSRFCKGLITYREGYLISERLSYTNYNYLFNYAKNKDTYSYLYLSGSTFLNCNAYTKVTALAIYGGITPMRSLAGTTQIETVKYPAFIHKGIIVNFEDFGGTIDIYKSNFQKNFHNIIEFAMMIHNNSDNHNLDQFKDGFHTLEYKMAICDTINNKDLYLAHTGIKMGDDMDALFDLFERLSVIYISRNRYMMVFRNNKFWRNLGTYGGAITINSPDWRRGNINKPYVIVTESIFEANSAYFSGNAIYMRNTMRVNRTLELCAGGHIENSLFYNNIGTKTHNGGAICAVCQYITKTDHDDYYQTSTISSIFSPLDLLQEVYDPVQSPLDSSTFFNVLAFRFGIFKSNFTENYAGQKGSAVYLKQMNKIKIVDSKFDNNGPVYSLIEQQSAVYYVYLSNRAMTYNDPTETCFDEFNYMAECDTASTYVEWPSVQGAVHIQFCQESFCMNENTYQYLIITNCDFQSNDAGPTLDSNQMIDHMAGSLYINGGFSITITKCKFRDHKGNYDYFAGLRAPKIFKYFPNTYFQYAQSPIIRIKVHPPTIVSDVALNFTTAFTNCSFTNNKHANTIGFGNTMTFAGSLLVYETNYFKSALMSPSLQMNVNTIRDNKFLGNKTALIYLFNAPIIFNDNLVYGNGYMQSAFLVTQTKPSTGKFFPYSGYNFYMYQNYGVLSLNGDEVFPSGIFHQIQRNTFAFSVAYYGAAVSIFTDNQYIYSRSNNYVNNYAVIGSSIYSQQFSGRSTFYFLQEIFINQFGLIKGAVVFESNSPDIVSFVFYESVFKNCRAQQGGAINAQNIGIAMISLSSFFDDMFDKDKASIIAGQYQPLNWKIYELIEITLMNQLSNNVEKKSGSIYLSNGKNTKPVIFPSMTIKSAGDPYLSYSEIIDCTFFKLNATTASAVKVGGSINVRIRNSLSSQKQFANCTQINFGVIAVQEGGTLIGENLMLIYNQGSQKGAVIGISESTVVLVNCTFRDNRAFDKGIIYLITDSRLVCNNCTFVRNYANDSSTIFAMNNIDGRIDIVNSFFVSNGHGQNLMNLIYTPTFISNSNFIDNIGQQVNHGITLIGSQLHARNITVTYTNRQFLSALDSTVDSGFFSLTFQSLLNITGSLIANCRGSQAAVIYATGASSVYFDGYSIVANSTSVTGHALFFTLTTMVRIANTLFYNNNLADIYIEKSQGFIINSTFIASNVQSIIAEQSSLTVFNSTFRDAANPYIQGKGIYCQCQQLLIDSCTFTNLTALEGGAVYLTSFNNQSSFVIRFTKFIGNQAMQGGAVHIADAANLVLSTNQFYMNTATLFLPSSTVSLELVQKGMGGGLFLNCFNQPKHLVGNCKVSLIQNNIFANNSASHDGGALLWLSNGYQDDGTNTFYNNTSPYGPDIGSYPKMYAVDFADNNDYFNRQNKEPQIPKRFLLPISKEGRLLQNQTKNTSFPDIVSGTPFYFLVYLIDQNGNLYSTEQNSTAYVSTQDNLVIKGGETSANRGIYNFSSVTVIMDPGTNGELQLEVNIQNYNYLPFFTSPFGIKVKARRCQLGEAYTSDKRCVQCSYLEYLFVAPQKETPCKVCPQEAQCYGRNLVGPAPGYWRSSNESENFIKCFNYDACLGGDSNEPMGRCAVGYSGVLCADCKSGFRKVSNFKCIKCPTASVQVIIILILLIVCGFIIFLFVRVTYYCSDKQKAQHAVYLRIITDHIQIMAYLFTINFSWSNELKAIQDGQAFLSEIVDLMFSFECFWQNENQPGVSTTAFTAKLIFFALLPLILTGITLGFWAIYCAIIKSFHGLKDKIISTVVIILFIVHPPITQVIFQTLNCINIEGVNRLQRDLETICFQGQHMILILVLAGPALLLWVLGIPLVFLAMLLKNKKSIAQMEHAQSLSKSDQYQITQTKKKYGFLFIGLKTSGYYWAIVVMIKKVMLIMTIVLLSTVSSDTQVLIALLIIIFVMILQVRIEPFHKIHITRMVHYALQVQTLTLYVGMFFVTGAHYNYMKNDGARYFLLVVIILSNLGFLFYWGNYVRIEILMLALERSRKLFRYLSCCCINADRFQKQYMIDADAAELYLEKPGADKDEVEENGLDKQKKKADDFSNVIMQKKKDEGSQSPRSSDSEYSSKLSSRKKDSDGSQATGRNRQEEVDPADVQLDFPMRMMRRIIPRDEAKQYQSSDRSILMKRSQLSGNKAENSYRKVHPEQ